jgi:hypothetical protein
MRTLGPTTAVMLASWVMLTLCVVWAAVQA